MGGAGSSPGAGAMAALETTTAGEGAVLPGVWQASVGTLAQGWGE